MGRRVSHVLSHRTSALPASRAASLTHSHKDQADNAEDDDALGLDGVQMDDPDEVGIPLPYVLNFMQDHVTRHRLVREMLVFVPFLIMFIFFATMGRNVEDEYFIGRVLRDLTMGNEIPTDSMTPNRMEHEVTRTFEDVVVVEDFFDWLQGVFVPNVWTCSLEKVVTEAIPAQQGLNYVLGSIRVRTLRANRRSCKPDGQLFVSKKGEPPPPLCDDIPSGELWQPPNLEAINTVKQCHRVFNDKGIDVRMQIQTGSPAVTHLPILTQVNIVEVSTDRRAGRIAGPVAGWIDMQNNGTNITNVQPYDCKVDCLNCLGSFSSWSEETAVRFNVSNPLLLNETERNMKDNRLYQWISCSNMPGGTYIVGDMDVYHCGGYFVDIPLNISCGRALEVVDVLRGDGWVLGLTEPKAPFLDSIQSRFASVEYFTYSPFPNAFVSVKLFIEIGPSGVVLPRFQFRTFKIWTADRNVSSTVYDFFFFIFVLVLLVNFFIEWRRSYVKTARIVSFLVDDGAVWHILEFGNLVTLIVVFSLRLAWWHASTRSSGMKFPISHYPPDLDFLKDLYMTQVYANSFNIVLSFLKILKYCQLNAKLNILTATLSKARGKVVGVLLLFSWSVFTYALAGHSLFGAALFGFRNVNSSYSTLMRMLLGDFDYEALRRENRILAGLFFWTYATLCLFLLLNFIIAIIGEAFSEAAGEVISVPFHISVERFKRSMMHTLQPANLIAALKLLLKRKSRGHLLEKALNNMEMYQTHIQMELERQGQAGDLVTKEKLKSFMGVEVYFLLGSAYFERFWNELEDDFLFNIENDPEEMELVETGRLVESGVASAIGMSLEGINQMPDLTYALEESVDDVIQMILALKRAA